MEHGPYEAKTGPKLNVAPTTALISSGRRGAPFSPSSLSYTLTNSGTARLNWAATRTQVWVTVSPAMGSLAAGATAMATVSINSSASGLSVGGYTDTVTFTNTTNGDGTTTRAVGLTVRRR